MFLLAIYIYWLIGGPMGLTIIVVWLISLGVMAFARGDAVPALP